MKKSDEVFKCRLYRRRGVHYGEPWPNAGTREAIIQETSIEVFANGGQVHIDPSTPTRYTPEQLAQRAQQDW